MCPNRFVASSSCLSIWAKDFVGGLIVGLRFRTHLCLQPHPSSVQYRQLTRDSVCCTRGLHAFPIPLHKLSYIEHWGISKMRSISQLVNDPKNKRWTCHPGRIIRCWTPSASAKNSLRTFEKLGLWFIGVMQMTFSPQVLKRSIVRILQLQLLSVWYVARVSCSRPLYPLDVLPNIWPSDISNGSGDLRPSSHRERRFLRYETKSGTIMLDICIRQYRA